MAVDINNFGSLFTLFRPEFLDFDLAVYRPWFWIDLPAAAGQGDNASDVIRVNYPPGPGDEKFRLFKDFKWSTGGDGGEQVQLTIFDDRATYNSQWVEMLQAGIFMPPGEKNKIKFQWGWAPRFLRGADNNEAGSIPSNRTNFSSGIHVLYLKNFETEYVEGGINYRLTGTDPMSNLAFLNNPEQVTNSSIELSVNIFIRKICSEVLQILPKNVSVEFTKEFENNYNVKLPSNFYSMSNSNALTALQNWMTQILPKSKNETTGPTLKVENTPNGHKIIFDVSHKKDNNYLFNGMILHINPPNNTLFAGKNMVINFKPQFAGGQAYVFPVNYVTSGNTQRDMFNLQMENDPNKRAGQGTTSTFPGPAVDSPISAEQSLIADKKHMNSRVAGHGVPSFAPERMDIELVGIPYVDSFEDLGKKLKIKVWNPAFIDEDIVWRRNGSSSGQNSGPFDNRYPPITMVKNVTHMMNSEGAYTTLLSVGPSIQGEYEKPLQKG